MRKYLVSGIVVLRFLSALPFAVYYSSLQLYLLSIGINKDLSISFVGVVLAFNFGLSLWAGYIGERYISFKNFFLISFILQTIGCLTFTTTNLDKILWFSTFFAIGSSGTTVSINMILTKIYESSDYSREKAFFWLYMSLNLGYFLGYSLAGYYGKVELYQNIPYFIIACLFIALIPYFLMWKKIEDGNKRNNISLFIITYITALVATRYLLELSRLTNVLIVLLWLGAAVYMLYELKIKHVEKSRNITIFYLLISIALIFWSIYFLAPMALIVFISNQVNLNFFGFYISPQWVQNINTIVIIVGTILLSTQKKFKFNSTQAIIKHFNIGLLLLGLGFLTLVFGIVLTTSPAKVNFFWVAISYILQSIGELFIGPISFALVGRLIPTKYQSFMMGIWVTLLGVAGAIASKISLLAPYEKESTTPILNHYANFFLVIGLIVIFFFLVFYCFSKKYLINN